MDDPLRGRCEVLLLGALFEGGLAMLAWLLGWLIGQPPLDQFEWRVRDAVLGAVGTLPLFAFLAACVRLPYRPLARIRRTLDETLVPLFRSSGIVDLAVISILAGIGEEMLFRGVLQAAVGRWLGIAWGVALASALFGAVHAITPAYAAGATLIGAYLGWLTVASGNLLPAIVAHALYDFVALVYLVRVRARPTVPDAPFAGELPRE